MVDFIDTFGHDRSMELLKLLDASVNVADYRDPIVHSRCTPFGR
jgi:hypothetical protein